MTDQEIIALYFSRKQTAIEESRAQYGGLVRRIIGGILHDRLDVEECENDTYLQAWNAIPPNRPRSLKAFLAAIARNIACNRYKYLTAAKRSPEVLLSLDELAGQIADEDAQPTGDDVLREAINGFLATLRKEQRQVFLLRYWQFCPVEEIAARTGFTKSKTESMLHRIRCRLKDYLTERGLAP